MTKIAVLGLGAMGSRMALNLVKAGHDVRVWNRTPSAMAPLVSAGARAASSPHDAAGGADVVIAMVRDDDASREIWLDPKIGAANGMAPGAIAVESSTLTPTWVRDLGKALADRNLPLIEAPVSGSRAAAEAAQLVYFVGGDLDAFAKIEPLLKAMGSVAHHVGALGNAAQTKLATNALLGIQVAAHAELIGWLKSCPDINASTVLKAIAGTSVWAPVAGYLTSSMLAENFAPQFPIDMIAKDFRYALDTAAPGALPMTASALAEFDKAIAEGLGALNMTGLAKLH